MDNAASADGVGHPRRWWFLLLLALVYACHHLDRTILFSLLEPIRKEFGLSDGQLGLLTGLIYGLSFGLAALPIGFLIDRVSRRRLLGVAAIVWSGLTALTGAAQSFLWLAITRFGVGAAEAAGAPASLSLISDLFPPKRRGTAIGLLYASLAVGGVAAALIAGVVAPRFGWRVAFLIAGIPGVLLGLTVLLILKEPARGASEPSGAGAIAHSPRLGVWPTLRFLAAQGAFLNVLAGITLAVVATASTGVWLTALLTRYHHLTLGQAAGVMGLSYGVFAALGSVAGGFLGDWAGQVAAQKRVLVSASCMIVVAPLLAAGLLVDSIWVAVPCLVLCPAIIQAALAPAFATGLSLVPPSMRGTAGAVLQLGMNLLGAGAGPAVVGMMSDNIGLQAALTSVAVSCALWSAAHFALASGGYRKAADRLDVSANPASALV